MKHTMYASLAAGLLAMAVLITGCGGSGGTKMDTTQFDQAFASADAAVKSQAEEASKALNAGKLLEGATAMANIAKAAENLTEEQKAAMVDVGATIQLLMSDDGDKADLKVYQAVQDMLDTLDGREPVKVGTTPDREALKLPPPTE